MKKLIKFLLEIHYRWILLSLFPLFGAIQSYRYLDIHGGWIAGIILLGCLFLFVTMFIHAFKKY